MVEFLLGFFVGVVSTAIGVTIAAYKYTKKLESEEPNPGKIAGIIIIGNVEPHK